MTWQTQKRKIIGPWWVGGARSLTVAALAALTVVGPRVPGVSAKPVADSRAGAVVEPATGSAVEPPTPSTEDPTAEPASDPAAEAQALLERSDAAMAGQQWARAHALLLRAYELDPSYDKLWRLGEVSSELGRYAEAAGHLWRAISSYPAAESAQRRARIEELFARVKSQAALVRVVLVPANADLLVDGALESRSEGDPVFLEPGEHILTAEDEGYEPLSQVVMAIAGAEATATFELEPSPPRRPAGEKRAGSRKAPPREPAAADKTPKSLESTRDVTWAVVIGGSIATAACGVAVGFTFAADHSKQELDTRLDELGDAHVCSDPARPARACGELRTAAEAVDRERNLAYAGLGVASAAIVGTLAYVFWPSGRRPGIVTSSRPRVRVGAGPGQVSLSGWF